MSAVLASVRLEQNRSSEAIKVIEPAPGEISSLVRFHALAAGQRADLARQAYEDTSELPEPYLELREEIARRFNVIEGGARYNRDWLKQREHRALVFEAA